MKLIQLYFIYPKNSLKIIIILPTLNKFQLLMAFRFHQTQPYSKEYLALRFMDFYQTQKILKAHFLSSLIIAYIILLNF